MGNQKLSDWQRNKLLYRQILSLSICSQFLFYKVKNSPPHKHIWTTLQFILQAVDKLFAKKFDEQIVSLLLRMYEPTSEGSDLSQFTKLVSLLNLKQSSSWLCARSPRWNVGVCLLTNVDHGSGFLDNWLRGGVFFALHVNSTTQTLHCVCKMPENMLIKWIFFFRLFVWSLN